MAKKKIKYDLKDYISVAQLYCDWGAEGYNTGITLTTEQIRFAIAYEVAKRYKISIQAADTSYSFFQCDLPSSMPRPGGREPTRKHIFDTVSNKFADAISAATPDKPAVLLVNFKIDARATPGTARYIPGAKHWVPVIITKNKDGAVTLTTINSSTSLAFNTSELEKWVEKAATSVTDSGLTVYRVDASRDVQTGNVCGLATASAVGIAVHALKTGHPSIDKALFADEITGDNLEEHYVAQGKRVFAALEFLAIHKDDRESPIDIVERRMLDKYGLAGVSLLSSSSAAAEASYNIVLSEQTLKRINEYKMYLSSPIGMEPGKYLSEVLQAQGYTADNIGAVSSEKFIELLLATKRPQIFAESAIVGDGSDWNITELGLLGDINVTAAVTIYDDGVWGGSVPKVHTPPLEGELLFTPGALLHGEAFKARIPDLLEVTEIEEGDRINQEAYNALVERRLLPLLAHANSRSTPDKPALVVLPGIGCGAFAGSFRGRMAKHLDIALVAMLEKHGSKFPNIATVHFDPFNECHKKEKTIRGIKYKVFPSRGTIPQLSNPGDFGVDPAKCSFFKIVAWDHVSLPGNDYFIDGKVIKGRRINGRNTDDGAVGAATNIMQVITGVKGEYTAKGYRPPLNASLEPYESWEAVANEKHVHLETKGRVMILQDDGQYVKLQSDPLPDLPAVPMKTKPLTDVPEVLPSAEELGLVSQEELMLKRHIDNAARNAARDMVAARNYNINYMLTDEQTKFALLYEVARHLGTSIKDAWMSYNLAVCPLATMRDAVNIDNIIKDAITCTRVGKPTVILANYKLDNSEKPGESVFIPGITHWAQVIISKNADNKLLVTCINSDTSLTFNTKEFRDFVSSIVRTAQAEGLEVSETEASRKVQIGLVCGLSSASAGGIAINLLSRGEVISREAVEKEESDKLNSEDPHVVNKAEIYYNAQGRRTLAVMEYLAAHPEHIHSNINLVEERALVECGILTEKQISSRTKFLNPTIDDLLVQRETLRFGITRLIKDCKIESMKTPKTINDFVEDLTQRYTTPSGFDVEEGLRDMESTLTAIYSASQGYEMGLEQSERPARKSPGKKGMRTPEKRYRADANATSSNSKKPRGEESVGGEERFEQPAGDTPDAGSMRGHRDKRSRTDASETGSSPEPVYAQGALKKRKMIKSDENFEEGFTHESIRFLERILDVSKEYAPGLVEQYISRGGNIDCLEERSGRTPLMYAIQHKRGAYCRDLIRAGANLEIKDKEGRTVLGWAIEKGDLPLIIQLLQNGAKIENANYTAPWYLAWSSHMPQTLHQYLQPTAAIIEDYKANPAKWLIDTHASQEQIANFISCSIEAGNFNIVAAILRRSPDMGLLNNERVIGVLYSDSTTALLAKPDASQVDAATYVLAQANIACPPGLLSPHLSPDRER